MIRLFYFKSFAHLESSHFFLLYVVSNKHLTESQLIGMSIFNKMDLKVA